MLGLILAATLTLTASPAAGSTRSLRHELAKEMALLRQSLYASPDLHAARHELLRTTREWSSHRQRILTTLERHHDYNKLRQDLWQAELNLREIVELFPNRTERRLDAALDVLRVKQQMRTIERAAMDNDPAVAAARVEMVEARREMKRILDDIQYRLRNDHRLTELRSQIAAR